MWRSLRANRRKRDRTVARRKTQGPFPMGDTRSASAWLSNEFLGQPGRFATISSITDSNSGWPISLRASADMPNSGVRM